MYLILTAIFTFFLYLLPFTPRIVFLAAPDMLKTNISGILQPITTIFLALLSMVCQRHLVPHDPVLLIYSFLVLCQPLVTCESLHSASSN